MCDARLLVRKTGDRTGVTLAHGLFREHYTEQVCPNSCAEEGVEKDRPAVWRSSIATRLLLPHSKVGYDVLVHIGSSRFLDNRSQEEIRDDIEARCNVELSTGEVSDLCRKFCAYLGALHRARAPQLRALLESDGGWPAALDATGEGGKGTLLVARTDWRGWVLGAWKIPTERAESILPRIREVAALFGTPLSLMHDLGRAVGEASRDFVAESASQGSTVVNLVCHLHFAADIGKDLLEKSHDALRALFRRTKTLAKLKAFSRDLARTIGPLTEADREKIIRWFAQEEDVYQLPAGKEGIGVVRAMAQWACDYANDATDKGFPFDRPSLDFYIRCDRLLRAVEAFLGKPHFGNEAYAALDRLFGIVITVRSQVPFGRLAAVISSRAKIFDDLRDALRIELKPKGRNEPRPESLPPGEAVAQLHDIKTALDTFSKSLRSKAPERGLANDTSAATKIVLTHLDKYQPLLFGHALALPASRGGGVRVTARTNVPLEKFFGDLKHGMRRCSGSKNLGQNLEHMPAEAVLATNLLHKDYLDAVCGGSLDGLPAAFAELDAGHRDKCLSSREARQGPAEVMSASLSSIDRKLVRSMPVTVRLLTAARSRSVRLGP